MKYIFIVMILSIFSMGYAAGDRKDGWSDNERAQDVHMGGD